MTQVKKGRVAIPQHLIEKARNQFPDASISDAVTQMIYGLIGLVPSGGNNAIQ